MSKLDGQKPSSSYHETHPRCAVDVRRPTGSCTQDAAPNQHPPGHPWPPGRARIAVFLERCDPLSPMERNLRDRDTLPHAHPSALPYLPVDLLDLNIG